VSFGVREMRVIVLVGLGRVAEARGDAAGARSRHREALAVTLAEGDLRAASAVAEGLAGVALIEGDGERAALLLGAGTVLRGTSVAGDPDVARVADGSRELIGEAPHEQAFERGAAMEREDVIALLGKA
jgi:hypothetical protein